MKAWTEYVIVPGTKPGTVRILKRRVQRPTWKARCQAWMFARAMRLKWTAFVTRTLWEQ